MKMLKAEWKNLFHSKKLLIIVFGLLLIPILYAGVFLDAMWDPYGSVENLPVAVANEDVAADFEGEKLQLGNELVDRLKDDNSLAWQFTDRQSAMKGLEDGDYYMVLVIPEDFSENASTVLAADPEEMNLEYYTNSGQNFIAEKISASAAEDINKEIAQSVTREYADTMFTKLNNIGDGLAEGADGADDMKDGSQELGDNLEKLSDSIVTFENGLVSAKNGTEEIAVNVGEAAQGASELAKGVKEYTSGVSQLNGGIMDYASGVGTLNNGLQRYTAGVNELNKGLDQYTSGVGNMENGLERQAEGTSELASRSSQLVEGAAQLEEGLESLSPGIHQLDQGAQSAAENSNELDSGLSQLADSGNQLQDRVDELAENLLTSSANSEQLIQGLNEITAGLKELKGNIEAAETDQAGQEISEQLNTLKADHDAEIIETIENSQLDLTAEEKQTLIEEVKSTQEKQSMQPIVDSMKEQLNAVNEKMQSMAIAVDSMIASLEGSESAPGAVEGVAQLAEGYQQLEKVVVGDADSDTLQGGVVRLNQSLQDAHEGSSALNEGLNQLAANNSRLAQGTSDLQNGAKELDEGIQSYTAGVHELNNGAANLESGAGQLTARSSELKAGAQQLDEQGEQLSNGSDKLEEKGSDLQSGSQTLADNGQNLRSGAKTLAQGLPKLKAGINSLNGGIETLYDGSLELESGAAQMADGGFELANGAGELANKLQDGAEEIDNTNTGESNTAMFSSPTKLLNDEVASVPNYGYGLAPYMMSVALFVGAVIFCLLFPIFKPNATPTSALAWWISKYSIVLLVSVLQATIMVSIMIWGLDLKPNSVGELFAVAITTSFAFMALISFFSIVLGNVGRFLMLLLLTFQLGGSAGTFPIELSNWFFQAIHPFLPMTYSIDAYRQAISLGGSIVPDLLVLLSIFVICQLGIIVFFTVKTTKMKRSAEKEAIAG
ncbi:YhgE/Pip domain-containing protein [Sediminibacillus albus]|uniref:Putative membrane protein n=1 Tax=Sediminibacillus albus TaxID=407036 RepID=A0A1G9ALF2_9BACI|nr:YhgE/Pip domain-containing protein [Sediminibacillus albus]SDK27345.1 putative membrane protein [Sediminibacillus albus]